MNVQELIRGAGKTPLPPVVLFCPYKSPKAREATFEPYLAEEAIEKVVAAAVEPTLRDLAYSAFYADETAPAEIALEAQTLPFLAARRVVLVRNAELYNFESKAGVLIHYIENASDRTLLLLLASQIDRRTKFFKLCEKHGLIVECPMLSDSAVADWVRARAEERGKKIEPAATSEIVRRSGLHLSDVNNALNVVVSFVGDAPVIHEQDVVKACADVAEEEVWTLTDAIGACEPNAALTALRKLIDMGKHPDELVGAINWIMKSAYQVAAADKGAPPVSPFVKRKVEPIAAKLGAKKLRDALMLVTDTHFMMRSTGVDANLALELLVVKLAASRQTPAARATG
ncbi:MAG: DNA polymerase III subunit delta [Candidatus Hydrogenedentes bacterium]|nr:DNA polymerase III subunit delta [Candidatus Hydrogenedentota bacterium]